MHEIKHDKSRTIPVIERGQAGAFTRRRLDWSQEYGRITDASVALKCRILCASSDPNLSCLGGFGAASTLWRKPFQRKVPLYSSKSLTQSFSHSDSPSCSNPVN
jgi:hypothetical protein